METDNQKVRTRIIQKAINAQELCGELLEQFSDDESAEYVLTRMIEHRLKEIQGWAQAISECEKPFKG